MRFLPKKKKVPCDECHQEAMRDVDKARKILLDLDKDKMKQAMRELGSVLEHLETPV